MQASTGSLTSYGLWKIAVSSGALEPQDPLARQLQSDVEAQCALGVLASLATATPPPPPLAPPYSHPHSTGRTRRSDHE